ncbi:type II secretion system F family protein [Pseudoduganella sp. RAF19]|uniref:type II secretion system F family protein n=1 Tax=Pseudoduganella sp. RAF19 TaxID=3233052 RepID=UPI003F9CD498
MSGGEFLFLLIVFLVVAGLVLAATLLFASQSLRERLRGHAHAPNAARPDEGGGLWIERVARVAEPFTRLSLPEEGWERSALRMRFINAGWRNASAPTLYFAAKTVLALLLPALMAILLAGSGSLILRQYFLAPLLGAAALGYYLPNGMLSRAVDRRRREIFENIPDALDLLTVCVEAGLSMERALSKVSAEIIIKSVVLGQELQLVLMEMRAGFSKERALRNLALRTGVEDMDALVAMLVQSERFGTSIGDSLRVHSENLRQKRSMMAQEAAAKVAVKLMFPLIFCIFPALLLVLLGPASIQISRMLGAVGH